MSVKYNGEISGDGLVIIKNDASLNHPSVKYSVVVDRPRLTDFLLESGFTRERLTRFSIRFTKYDDTADPLLQDDLYGRYDRANDQINIFTHPHYRERLSLTRTFFHETYHSLERDIPPSKWGRRMHRFSPLFLVTPMIVGGIGAYCSINPENPNPAPLLWAVNGVVAGGLLGMGSIDLPYYFSASERGARRFIKAKMADSGLHNLISMIKK